VCATSQAVNDWFDRHVDAINEPQRPIPSGRMPGRWGLYVARGLDRGCRCWWPPRSAPGASRAALLGLALAWAYSAPPLRLKQQRLVGQRRLRRCATRAWPGSPARP
jgi:chlorophyll synthase